MDSTVQHIRDWRPLFRVGGVAALLLVAFDVAALALYFVSPPPISGGVETLRFIAENKVSYIAQQLLWLAPSLFAVIVFTALFVAVLPRSPVLAVLGLVVGGSSWAALLAVPVTSVGTLSLVYLSDEYTAAAQAARAPFVAAAEALIAENNTVSLAGALTPLRLLLLCAGSRARTSRLRHRVDRCQHRSARPSRRVSAVRRACGLHRVRTPAVGVVRRSRGLPVPLRARGDLVAYGVGIGVGVGDAVDPFPAPCAAAKVSLMNFVSAVLSVSLPV